MIPDKEPKKGLFNWLFENAAKGTGEGISTLFKAIIISIPFIALLGVGIFSIAKINIGGVELVPNNRDGGSTRVDNIPTQVPVVFPTLPPPEVPNKGSVQETSCAYYDDVFFVYEETPYYDVEFNTGHWMILNPENNALLFGNSSNGFDYGYEGPSADVYIYLYNPGIWTIVHSFANSSGAFWACWDNSGIYARVGYK